MHADRVSFNKIDETTTYPNVLKWLCEGIISFQLSTILFSPNLHIENENEICITLSHKFALFSILLNNFNNRLILLLIEDLRTQN